MSIVKYYRYSTFAPQAFHIENCIYLIKPSHALKCDIYFGFCALVV